MNGQSTSEMDIGSWTSGYNPNKCTTIIPTTKPIPGFRNRKSCCTYNNAAIIGAKRALFYRSSNSIARMSSPHNMAIVMQQQIHLDFETDRNNRNRETTNHCHWEHFRSDKEHHHMLSTLDPILINTTQKSVESKQGICSSKPNAQQKLHAQKTFEIQKQFTNFFSSVTHSIHHKRASTGSSNFISCSTIISCLPCSFSPKYGTGTPKKTLCIRKEGIYCGSMRRERKRETYVCGFDLPGS